MGVFSRTMLMLTLVWLSAMIVLFLTKSVSNESDWRDKFVAEANIRRAIAYRYVDIKGGKVADRGTKQLKTIDNRKEEALPQESLNNAPYSYDDGASSGFTGGPEKVPGSAIPFKLSLIQLELKAGDDSRGEIRQDKIEVEGVNKTLLEDIQKAERARGATYSGFVEVRENIRLFTNQMKSYRYIIASFQAKAFNLDYEIQRVMVERDSLVAELAQLENDVARIGTQRAVLEDAYYGISKTFEKTIKVLGWYEQADPGLRILAESTGRGWLRGQVIATGDDPRIGVVTISLGSNDGVQESQVFTIFRNNKFVARMIIENVRADAAVGHILPEFRGKVVVLANDSVKTAEPLKRTR